MSNTEIVFPSPEQLLPPQFVERLKLITPPELLEPTLNSFCQTRPTTLRVNTLKTTPEIVKEELAKINIELEDVPWWPNAFIIKDRSVRQIFHELYTSGAIYIQGLSSILPPLVLDPQPGEKILDLTAAPGSKTTQMAALMNNSGEIIANDLSPIRLFKLQANLKMQGVTNTHTRKGPGQYVWEKFPEHFDRTLVDVPCSMEGRISCAEPESYEDWSMKEIKMLSMRQSHLLRSAVSATKPGGTIVYSTCTLAPEENEAVIQWLLEREGDAIEVEEINIPGLTLTPGLTSWQGQEFDPRIARTGRILPSETMEGFFVAKLRKLRSTLPAELPFRRDRREGRGHHKPFRKFGGSGGGHRRKKRQKY